MCRVYYCYLYSAMVSVPIHDPKYVSFHVYLFSSCPVFFQTLQCIHVQCKLNVFCECDARNWDGWREKLKWSRLFFSTPEAPSYVRWKIARWKIDFRIFTDVFVPWGRVINTMCLESYRSPHRENSSSLFRFSRRLVSQALSFFTKSSNKAKDRPSCVRILEFFCVFTRLFWALRSIFQFHHDFFLW